MNQAHRIGCSSFQYGSGDAVEVDVFQSMGCLANGPNSVNGCFRGAKAAGFLTGRGSGEKESESS